MLTKRNSTGERQQGWMKEKRSKMSVYSARDFTMSRLISLGSVACNST